jgi:hypothetical protein
VIPGKFYALDEYGGKVRTHYFDCDSNETEADTEIECIEKACKVTNAADWESLNKIGISIGQCTDKTLSIS